MSEVHDPSGKARAHRDAGLSHFDAGRFAEALKEFEAATDTDINFAEAYGWASAALVKLGRLEEAMRAVDHAIWLDQFYAWGWNRKGVVFHAMGDFGGAATCFRKALEADPKLKAAKENLQRVEPLIGVNAAIVDFGAEKQEPYRVEAKGAPKKGRKGR